MRQSESQKSLSDALMKLNEGLMRQSETPKSLNKRQMHQSEALI